MPSPPPDTLNISATEPRFARAAGCSGLLIVLPRKSADGRWDRGTDTARRLDAPLPHAAHITFCTDFGHPYDLIFARHHHMQGKAHTVTIESHNNRLRVCLINAWALRNKHTVE